MACYTSVLGLWIKSAGLSRPFSWSALSVGLQLERAPAAFFLRERNNNKEVLQCLAGVTRP